MNRQWILASRPVGFPTRDNFKLIETPVPQATEGQVLVRTLYLSVDPYQRGRMKNVRSYVKPLELDDVIEGGVVGQVVESRHAGFTRGDFVFDRLGWQDYALSDGKTLRKLHLDIDQLPLALGVLGMTGFTAYFGLLDLGQPKAGETVLVSGAAGAVGTVVGQIAKVMGCRAVGIAGTDEKATMLTKELGFDAAVNYKAEPNLRIALKKACPNGVDVYFDNVGGPVSDAAVTLINMKARILICGQIAIANREKTEMGPRNLLYLLVNRARMEGFLVHDYAARFPEAETQLRQWLQEGRIKSKQTIIEGLENAPTAFMGLFTGDNIGKQIVKVSLPINS